MLILEPIENFNLDLEELIANVFNEFLLFLKKSDYNALHKSENFEKKKVKHEYDPEIWTIINENHAICMYCNDHLYCYTDFADMNSFFQRHINTEYHKSCRLLNPLTSNTPMFTWEDEGIVGHCNVCNISGLEVIIFDTESNIHNIISQHKCDVEEKSIKLNLLKIFCSLNLFVQKFIFSFQDYSVCALCNVMLRHNESKKIHFVSQLHFQNFLNFIYSKFKFEIKDLLNGFNLEKFIRYILVHKIVFNSVHTGNDQFTKQNCLHESNQSSLLYTDIPCYLQFIPKVIRDVPNFNPNDVIVDNHCLVCDEFNIQPDHILSVSHIKNLENGIYRIKRFKNYKKYLAVVRKRLQLFADYIENYNSYKSNLNRIDATLNKKSKNSTSMENDNSIVMRSLCHEKKTTSGLVEGKCENCIKSDESKVPVIQNDISSVPLMNDKANGTTKKNKRKPRRKVKKDKNSSSPQNMNLTNKSNEVSKCDDSNEHVEVECFDDGRKTAQKNDSKKNFNGNTFKEFERCKYRNRQKHRYKNNEKNDIKKNESPLLVTEMKKEGDSEAWKNDEKTMKNGDLSAKASLQNESEGVEDITSKFSNTFNIKEEKTYELESRNLTSTSTSKRLTENGNRKRRKPHKKPNSKPKIDVQQNQVNDNSSTGNITEKTSQKSAGPNETEQSLKTESESNKMKKNKKTKSNLTKIRNLLDATTDASENEPVLMIPALPKILRNEAELLLVFGVFGKSKRVIINRDKGEGYIIFENPKSIEQALKFSPLKIDGCSIGLIKTTRKEILSKENKMNAICVNFVENVDDFIDRMTKKIKLASIEEESKREKTLCNKIIMTLCTIFPTCECYVFGSRITGLSFETSDLDVFFDCGDAYEKSQYLTTRKHVSALARKVYKVLVRKKLFTEFNIVPKAQIPLVSFFDRETQLKCDLSFTNGLSVENSQVLKFLISLDWRIRILILAVKEWAILNNLHGRPMFSSYALALMTIFYLQQLPLPILPPIETLQKNYKGFRRTFNGWDCNINKDPSQLPKTENSDSPKVLFKGFFEYYKSFDYVNFIISPLTGQPLPKKAYKTDFTSLPMAYKRHFHNVPFRSIQKEKSIIWCVDPFNLGHIVTGQYPFRKVRSFLVFCEKSFELIK